jgi:hypothetical protein
VQRRSSLSAGTWEETTMRAVVPTSRASTYAPSRVSVRTSRNAFGFETSISESTDVAGRYGIAIAGAAERGVSQYPPRERTSRRSPTSRSS